MKRIEPTLISDAITQLYENNPDFHEKILEVKAKGICENYFKDIMRYICKIEITDSVLRIYVNSPNMRQYIMIDRDLIIDNINESLGVCLIREVSVI